MPKKEKTTKEEAPSQEPAKAAAPEEKVERTHKPRAKPVLDESERMSRNLGRDKKARNPRFLRQEWFRYGRVGAKWRKPRGLHSKMRRHIGYRPNVVSIGYRTPKATRGMHPSGFEEVMVHNMRDMEGIDPKRQAARIGHSVGYLKRMHIALKAEEMGIRILNFNRQTHEELLEEAKKRGIELPSGKAPAKAGKKAKKAAAEQEGSQ